jgi:hypothetical protein
MPRLETFSLEIRTGENRGPDRPKYGINGFPLEFDKYEGGTGSGETLRVMGSPQSFPHALTLGGPEEGQWDIESIKATYHCAGQEPYSVQLGAVTLDDETDLNIWYERPAPVFDV